MNASFENAISEYQAGRLDAALELAETALASDTQNAFMLLALAGNIHLKQNNRGAAAASFVRAADHDAAQAAGILKIAFNLFFDVSDWSNLVSVGGKIMGLVRQDPDLAYKLALGLNALGRVADVDPLINHLNLEDHRQLLLVVNHLYLTGRAEELAALLDMLRPQYPDNIFIQSARYEVARNLLEYSILAERDAVMADPSEPRAAQLLAQELAHARLVRSENESENAIPYQDAIFYQSSRPSDRSGRREISRAGTPIHIAYMSNDYYNHATMTWIFDMLVLHDRSRFKFTLLSYTDPANAPQRSHWPQSLQDELIDIHGLTDAQVGDLIRNIGVDILIDLKGHTGGSRPGITNISDAPIKVSYIGFAGSVIGVDLDYVITDPIITPDSSKPYYVEKLCRLPETYQPNCSTTRAGPGHTTRAEHGLPEGVFVFGSFNGSIKINRRVVTAWAKILERKPNSVLWALCDGSAAQRNLRAEFLRQGIAPERIFFAGRRSYAEHLSRIRLVDLVLDTMPYNGHTTTADVLWAGVPVVAVMGTSFASRVSASVLLALDVPELIAETDEAFVELAVSIANDPDRRAALRSKIAENRWFQPLFDSERFTRHIEQAYILMAERARAGLLPDHIDVPKLPPRMEPHLAAFFD